MTDEELEQIEWRGQRLASNLAVVSGTRKDILRLCAEVRRLKEEVKMAKDTPRRGEVWEHYQGALYEVLYVTRDEASGERRVIYHELDSTRRGEVPWDRPLTEWLEDVGGRRRFERMERRPL